MLDAQAGAGEHQGHILRRGQGDGDAGGDAHQGAGGHLHRRVQALPRQEHPDQVHGRRAGGGVERAGDVLADLVRYGLDLQLHGVHSTSR